jgi:hypothetical protein
MSGGRFKTKSAFFVAAALRVVLKSELAQACSVCGSDDPLVAVGDSSPNAGKLRLALSLSLVNASARSDDDPRVTEEVTRGTLTPTVVFSPLSRLNVALSVPVLRNRYQATGPEGQLAVTLTGVGDAELGLRYFAWHDVNFAARRRQEVAVSVGSSLPTGANDAAIDGERLDEHAQIGRGEFGPHIGALYALHRDPWHFTADASLRAYTTNHYGYRYGSAALWNATAEASLTERFALELGVTGRDAARDRQSAELQADTGGFVLQAVPGISLGLPAALWFRVRVELPFVTRLFGEQNLGPTFTASVQWAP